MVKMGNCWRRDCSIPQQTDSQYSTLSITSQNMLQWLNIRRPPCRVLNNDELWDSVDQKIRICIRKKVN